MSFSPVRTYDGILSRHCLTLEKIIGIRESASRDLKEQESERQAILNGVVSVNRYLPSIEFHHCSAEAHRICAAIQLLEYLGTEGAMATIDPFILASTSPDDAIGLEHFIVVPAENYCNLSLGIQSKYGRIKVTALGDFADGGTERFPAIEDFYRWHLEVQSSELGRWCINTWACSCIPKREIPPMWELFTGWTNCLSPTEYSFVRVLSLKVNGSIKTISGDTLCLLMDNRIHPLSDFAL